MSTLLPLPSKQGSGNLFLNHVMQTVLRKHIPPMAPDARTTDIYYEEVRLHSADDPVQGPYVMPLVTLRTNPCKWSTSAGCVMCGYHLGARRADVTSDDLLAQTDNAIARLPSKTYPSIVFTSNGSFFDPGEVPDEVRPHMAAKLGAAGFKFLVTESRPEFLRPDRLQAIAEGFGRPRVNGRYPISVSFGLESRDDFVQKYCVNKGRKETDYVDAFGLLAAEGFHYDTYVLLGKPFMTAREDIADAADTIRFAIDHGAEYVFVMVTNMVDYSLTSYLHEKNRYELPSLWRAVDLLEKLPDEYRRHVQVKGISHAPVSPNRYAETCPTCTEHVKGAINFWNMTADIEHIDAIYPCECRNGYLHRELNPTPQSDLRRRVRDEYELLAAELGISESLIPAELQQAEAAI